MQIGVLLTAMIVGVLVFFGLTMPGKDRSRVVDRRERRGRFGASNPFHAVSIMPAEEGCLAADALRVQRFLSEDAPGLPLPECSAAQCSCRYVHHADRRDGARDRRLSRAGAAQASEEYWSLRDRRFEIGRRQEDRALA